MSFSIKATIRAWWVPEHRLACSPRLWAQMTEQLRSRGQGRHEAGAFMLGIERDNRREALDIVYYDDLDPNAYASGVCVLHGPSFARLWEICRERRLSVVADVHTHPRDAFQSLADRTNPMVATAGHIAIILPDFAVGPDLRQRLGIFEYLGRHEWIDRSPVRATNFLYIGFWS
jgi:hypothetical protein